METHGDIGARIAAFLDDHHVMSLATAGADGPHAASLFYVRDGTALVWVSDAASRHSQELEADPRVSATVAPDYDDFAVIRGLQIAGQASRVAELGERTRLLALLGRRYSFLAQAAKAPAAVLSALQRSTVYRLQPRRIVFIDNTRGFGHKETLVLD